MWRSARICHPLHTFFGSMCTCSAPAAWPHRPLRPHTPSRCPKNGYRFEFWSTTPNFAKRPRNGRPGHPRRCGGAPAPCPPPNRTPAGSRAELQRPQRPNNQAVRAGVGRCGTGGSPSRPPLALAAAATLARKVSGKQRPDFASRPEACRAQAPQSFGSAPCTLFFL